MRIPKILRHVDSGKARDRQRLDLQMSTYSHSGVAPLAYVGVTWQKRGFGYWFRRSVCWFTMLFGTALCGGFAFGVSIGLGSSTVGKVILVFYWATLVPGLVIGNRMARFGVAYAGSGGGWSGGCSAILAAPLAAGVCLGFFVMTLGRDFPGEALARQVTEEAQRVAALVKQGGKESGKRR